MSSAIEEGNKFGGQSMSAGYMPGDRYSWYRCTEDYLVPRGYFGFRGPIVVVRVYQLRVGHRDLQGHRHRRCIDVKPEAGEDPDKLTAEQFDPVAIVGIDYPIAPGLDPEVGDYHTAQEEDQQVE